MTQITALSNEVLLIIFSSIDKISQVAECRLVCKHWSHVAETAMLGHNITISSERGLVRLYTLLIQHPEKATLVKHLHFDEIEFTEWLREFLGVAVTYNIESITGDVFDEEFFDTLIDIVEKSSIKFDKLKTLTVSPEIGQPFRELSLHLIDSIETMQVDFGDSTGEIDWDYVARFRDFKRLKTLTLKGRFTIDNLEVILNSCPPGLQQVTWMISIWTDNFTWNHNRTKKLYGVTNLSIRNGFISAKMIEYFLYKLANLDFIAIDVYWDNNSTFYEQHRIPGIISKVPHKDVIYTISGQADLKVALSLLESNEYTITFKGVKDNDDVCFRISFD